VIEVNEKIEVEKDPQSVWALLSNPREVVGCVSGASLGAQHEDGSYDAAIVVKFGPAKVAFKAKVGLELDAATRTGHVTSRGKDNQGGARFETRMTFKVLERQDPPGSVIPIEAKVDITGRLASVIETGAGLVVKRMTKEFSEQLAARFAGSSAG
jgi:carbon monoxide dehydrogenase subunit G